jgi:phospholipase/carboxylesterase
MKNIISTLVHRILPPENSQDITHPTLILLHGRGADEEDLLGLSASLDPRLFMISVRAPFSFPYGGGYTWYDVGAVGVPETTMFRTSYDKLSTFVQDAVHNYPIDPGRVFLFGFSMGTVMAYALALTRPSMFRGVVANSGYVPEGTHLKLRWNELSTVEFFIAHGTQDPVIPITFGRRAHQLLTEARARFTYKEYLMAHQISEESLTDAASWLHQRLNVQP